MPKSDPKRPEPTHEKEPDPRERLLKSDLPFEDLTRKILQKKPPAGGWQRGDDGEQPDK